MSNYSYSLFLAVYASSVLDGMHKTGNRNILSRKKKAGFENYGSFSHVEWLGRSNFSLKKSMKRLRQIQLQHDTNTE
jgi:hypothetical protein